MDIFTKIFDVVSTPIELPAFLHLLILLLMAIKNNENGDKLFIVNFTYQYTYSDDKKSIVLQDYIYCKKGSDIQLALSNYINAKCLSINDRIISVNVARITSYEVWLESVSDADVNR